MTPTEYAQIISSVGTLLAALGAFFMSYKNSKKVEESQKAIQEVHLSINSRMDQLLVAAKLAAHAAGVNEERLKIEK